MTDRVYNFSPGPAILPEEVLQRAQQDLFSLPGVGMSILEISHRSKPFNEILAATEANLRTLYGLPDNFRVLFLQGGSRLQFSMVPMNLLGTATADYLITGTWGKKSLDEARREGDIHVAYDGGETNYDRLPADGDFKISGGSAYVHFTSNETIQGVQFASEPNTGDVPLVCDASSDFLSRKIDVDRYGLIYACAQKNAGPAGVTVVFIRDDMLARCPKEMPGMLSYANHADQGSRFNTPPVFGIYIVNLVAEWLLNTIGGLDAIAKQNQSKASSLYQVIDSSDGFYEGHAQADCRSLMNVTFRLANDDLQDAFLAGAAERQLCSLKGHRSVGGFRASIYNAMPVEGVTALAKFMQDFRDEHK